jgi:TolB-like protein
LLYALLSFRPPIRETTLDRILKGELDPMEPSIPRQLRAIVLKAMALEKTQRYSTVAELAADVSAYLNGRDGTVFKWSPAQKAAWAVRRHPRAASGAACLVLAVLAMLGVEALLAPPLPAAVVVLPFRNDSDDRSLDYLSVLLAEEFNTQLRGLGKFHVRPLQSVREFVPGKWDRERMVRDVQADTVIEGSYTRSPAGLRLNVALVDVRENRQIWSEQFEEPSTDILPLLERAARRMVGALRLQATAAFGTKNKSAYELYLRGRFLLLETDDARSLEAIQKLEEAVRLDPSFARAYAALASALAARFMWNFSDDRAWLERAEKNARRALELEPNLAEAHSALAAALEGLGRRAECVRQVIACYRVDPRHGPAILNLARYAFYMGEFDAALELLDRLAMVDPAANVAMRKAIYEFFAGRLDQSRAEARKAESRAIGDDEYTLIGICYVWLDDLVSARRMLEKLEAKGASGRWEVSAWIHTAEGKLQEARGDMDRLPKKGRWGIAQEMAALYAIQGDRAKALEWLQQAVELGGPSYAWFASRHLQSLKGDPAYERVLKTLSDEYAPLRQELRATFRSVEGS